MAFGQDDGKTKDLSRTQRVHSGTFSGGAPTAGEIVTGLASITYAEVTGATALAASGGTLTVTSAATSGYWMAVGR